MKNKQTSSIIVIIGVGLLLASLLADIVGIGDDPGFGKQQLSGTVAGVIIMFLGLAVMKKTP